MRANSKPIPHQPLRFALRYLLLVLTLFGTQSAFAESGSEVVVKQLVDRVSTQLDKLYKENRIDDRGAIEQMIRTEIVPHIDKEYLARRVFRQFWRDIVAAGKQQDAEQRVIDSVVRTYAVALSSYSGDTLQVISVNEEGNKSTARSRIRRPNGQIIQVDFALSNRTGPWMINDIAVDGIVASLTLYKSIKPIWEEKGMEAALNAVHEADTAQTASADPKAAPKKDDADKKDGKQTK